MTGSQAISLADSKQALTLDECDDDRMDLDPIPQSSNMESAENTRNAQAVYRTPAMRYLARDDDGIIHDFTRRFQALTLDECIDDRMDLDPQSSNMGSAENAPNAHQVYHIPAILSMFCKRLVCEGAITNFSAALESVAIPWSRLLRDTAVPNDARSIDSRFVRAFKALDLAITVPESSCVLLPRLAIVRLFHLTKVLEARVARDRKAGRIAQSQLSPPSRHSLIHRKRLAKRWSELAGPWPLFVLIYSQEAENIMFDYGFITLIKVFR